MARGTLPPEPTFAHLDDKHTRPVLDQLAIGGSAKVESYMMLVEPGGKCYVDQFAPIPKDDPICGYITVTRLENDCCTVDLTQVAGFKYSPRPINHALYAFKLWTVTGFVNG